MAPALVFRLSRNVGKHNLRVEWRCETPRSLSSHRFDAKREHERLRSSPEMKMREIIARQEEAAKHELFSEE